LGDGTLLQSHSEPQVKILDKALRVLMLFSPEQPEWGVSAVSREVMPYEIDTRRSAARSDASLH
jgi:hypothetical protein